MNVWLHGWLINYDDLLVSVFICDQERDAMRLMSCVGQVLSVLPIPDIMNYLDAILVPRLTNMQQLVKQEVGFCMFLFRMCLNVIHTITHTKQKTHDASYGSWKKRKRPVVLQFFSWGRSMLCSSRSGVGKLQPVGHIRPADVFGLACLSKCEVHLFSFVFIQHRLNWLRFNLQQH